LAASDKESRLKKYLMGRGMSAVAGLFLMAAANPATAAPLPSAAVSAGAVDPAAKPLAAATVAVATASGSVLQAQPAASVSMTLVPAIATEATWLQRNGWPLYALVDRYSAGAPLDEQANCIAVAVYHEARGETLEGQLAVARVIMNRAVSGRYPASWCGVVKQPWQFSFVRNGRMPSVDESSTAWRNALGITRLAINNAVPTLSDDVLWYHANYVAPSWGRRLTRVSQIGAHVFYRA
jgi:spore germination cell wall hydrolase CwlJ-like protein